MAQLDNNRLRQVFFILILLGLGILLFWHIYPFFTALLGALTFYMLFRKMQRYLTVKKKWKKSVAAIAIMVLSFIIILLPTAFILKLLYNEVIDLSANSEQWIGEIEGFIKQLNETFGINLLDSDNLQKLPSLIAGTLPSLLLATLDTLVIVALLYFVLYFMLIYRDKMENWIFEYVPLKDENLKKIENEIVGMVLSNAIGIPLLAVIQGIFAFVAYWFLDVPEPLLWGSITAFASMLPVIGSTAIWFPLSLYLYFNGMEWQGITLWLYGVIIIINVDNVFRMILQKGMADTHPLITMFGVLVGVSLFGFIGLIFGPLLVSMFIVLLRVYRDEFLTKQRQIETTEN